MGRFVSYLRQHHVGLLALCLALTGTAYAATLPRHSVGKAQLKRNAVTSAKVKNHSLLRKDFKAGQLPRGPAGARGPEGPRGLTGNPGGGGIIFAEARPAGEDPPASPQAFAGPTLAFNLPTSGKVNVNGSIDATGSCPAGPDPCTFETGLYLDGVAISGTGSTIEVPAGSGPFTCGGGSPFFFGGSGMATSVPAGSHQLSIGYSQTGGAAASLSFDCEPFLQAIGPFLG